MHKQDKKIDWNKEVKYESKQAFIDAHKEAYPSVDLGAEYDKHFSKSESLREPVKKEVK